MSPIHRRAATEKELKALAEKLDANNGMYGCITVICLVIPAAILFVVGGAVGSLISSEAALLGRWLSPVLALILYLIVVPRYTRGDRKRRARIQKDLDYQEIEEIQVHDARVILLRPPNAAYSGALVFGLPDRKLFFLTNRDLHKPAIYGAANGAVKIQPKVFNSLEMPYSFPSTRFVVRRFPHSGEILRIEVQGEYLAPEPSKILLSRAYKFRPSEIFSGSTDNIGEILEIEHAQRKRGDTL